MGFLINAAHARTSEERHHALLSASYWEVQSDSITGDAITGVPFYYLVNTLSGRSFFYCGTAIFKIQKMYRIKGPCVILASIYLCVSISFHLPFLQFLGCSSRRRPSLGPLLMLCPLLHPLAWLAPCYADLHLCSPTV